MSRARLLLPCLLLALSACGTASERPVADASATPAPAAATPVADAVPAELRAFAAQVREAFLAKDLDRFMSHFHPDYRGDGNDLAAQREHLRTMVFPFVEKWEYRIDSARIDGDKAIVKAEFVTEHGNFPGDGVLVRHDGRWVWYGNRK